VYFRESNDAEGLFGLHSVRSLTAVLPALAGETLISLHKLSEDLYVVFKPADLSIKGNNLLFELLILTDLGVDIEGGFVANEGSHAGVGECLQGLLEVGRGRVETGDHETVGIATNRLL
jgi:hypothetical protein